MRLTAKKQLEDILTHRVNQAAFSSGRHVEVQIHYGRKNQ